MLDVKGYFRVNKVRALKVNIQYAVLLLKDRMLFVKIGGQFADGVTDAATVGGIAGGLIGSLIDSRRADKAAPSGIPR